MSFDEIVGTTRAQLRRKVHPEVIGEGGTAIFISESQGSPLFVEMRVPKRPLTKG
jgi:hypothetical protein